MTQVVYALGIPPLAARSVTRFPTLLRQGGPLRIAVGVPCHVELLQEVLAIGGGCRSSGLDVRPEQSDARDGDGDRESQTCAGLHGASLVFHGRETSGGRAILPQTRVKSP